MADKSIESVKPVRDYKSLKSLLSYEYLLILALLRRYKKISQNRLADVLGFSQHEIENCLRAMEMLGAVTKRGDTLEIGRKGRKVARALELHKFDFANPEGSFKAHLADVKRKRPLRTFGFYFPKTIDLS